MNAILLAIDESKESKNAITYATAFAEEMRKDIVLVNVYQYPVSYSEVPVISIGLKEIEEESKHLLEKVKQEIKDECDNKIKIYTESIYGETSREISKLIIKLNPYLIIFGTKGVSGIERLFLGSTSLEVLRSTNKPILIITPEVKYQKIKKIGIAVDFEKSTETITLKIIRDIINIYKSKLTVVHVDYERHHFTAETPMETLNVDNLLSEFNPEYKYIENKDVSAGIEEFINDNEIDIIVVYPKKHTWFEKLFEKSITRAIIHKASKPVLCLKH